MKTVTYLPQAMAPSDAHLLASIRDGDHEALGVLFDRHAPDVLRYARRVAVGEDADDILQDTFLRVLRVASSYEPRSTTARAWIIGVCHAVIRERKRSFSRLRRMLSNLAREPQALSRPASQSDLVRSLSALSEDKRALIVMADLLGFSTQEISAALGIPSGTVGSRLHSLRKQLRETLEDAHG